MIRKASWSSKSFLVGAAAATAILSVLAGPLAAAESKYKGTSIRFLTSRNVHQTALADKLAEIAKDWGVNFEVRYVTTDQLDKKTVLDHVGGATTWDIIYTGGVQRMFEWGEAGIVKDIAPLIQQVGDPKVLDFESFTPSSAHAVRVGEKVLGLPVAISEQALAYRRDIFDDAGEKAAFKAKYGYDLQVPDNYKQFKDVAEFFTRKKGQMLAGKPLEQDFYGASYSNKKGSDLWHDYMNVLLAFGVDVYDPKTGKVGLNTSQSIAAATYYQSLVPFLPPSHVNQSSGESTSLFANGQVAMVVEYFDRVVSIIEKGAKLTAKDVGYAFPPSQEGNPKNLRHPFRSAPAVVIVYSGSQNPEAAYKLLEAASSTDAQIAMGRKYPGFLPSRTKVLDVLAPEVPAFEYLGRLANGKVDAVTDAELLPYPSVLKAAAVGDAVSEAVAAILAGAAVEPQMNRAQGLVEKAIADVKR